MAEAHQGVAFSFAVTEDEGLHMNVSFETFKAVLLSGVCSWRKWFARLLNRILNGVYPSHPLRGVAFIGLFTFIKQFKNRDPSFGFVAAIGAKIPRYVMTRDNAELAACFLFAGGAWLSIVTARRTMLQGLFSYHGWMYESRGKVSRKTKIWAVLTKMLTGSRPNLYSCQSFLPTQPVPDLSETITRYLRTIKPLCDDAKYDRIREEAREFQAGVGRRLQRYLVFKSLISSNYVSDWWEEYVYLRGRSPIMVNSNLYAVDTLYQASSSVQAAHAANLMVAAFAFRRSIEDETLDPILVQDTIPLCSRQYERQFNTTRLPGEITDKLVHYKDSKHVAVYSRGKWYKLYAYYQSTPLNAKELERQLEKILEDECDASKGEKYLAALTAGNRVAWAQTRNKYFSKGVNRASLAAIEKAAFVLVLDDDIYECIENDKSVPSNCRNDGRQLDVFARALLHGRGYDRWFDKSFNLIVSKNGRVGLNIEHSWADAPVTGHMWESINADDIFLFGYEKDGHTKGVDRFGDLPDPMRLCWQFSSKIEDAIMKSYAVALDLLNDVDVHIMVHDMYGKSFIKQCKTSPDAYLQMALQLAYFRDIGTYQLTYEASMTRMFREGRTETVRACSVESCAWVRSMQDPQSTNAERMRLFRQACDYHQQQYRDAMTGKGVDRHLFCLYVVSKYLELDTSFLKEIINESWRLSTSQTPTSQTSKFDMAKYPDIMTAGGGFGPVADDGYGVSYIISGENHIFFHVSSKVSCKKTDSFRFGQSIKQVMTELKQMFEEYNANSQHK